MIIPNSAAYLEYEAAGTPGGGETFVAPGLNPSGLSYDGVLSSIEVTVNGEPLAGPPGGHQWRFGPGGSVVVMVPLEAGDRVEIWRETPVGESLVDYPTPNRYTPTTHNKSLKQIFLCLQELWGGLKWLLGYTTTKIAEAVENLEGQLGDLEEYLVNYVDNGLANLESQIEDLQAYFVYYLNHIRADVEQKIRNLEGQLGDLETYLVNYVDSAVANLEGQLGDLSGQLGDLSGQLGDLKAYLVNYVNNGLANLEGQLGDLNTYLVNYVNDALASYFSSPGPMDAPVVWTTTVNSGDIEIVTPFRFTQGLMFFGGATYALNDPTQVTLDQDLGFTRITLKEAALFTGTATIVTLSSRPEAQSVWTATVNSGDIEIAAPFRFTQGLMFFGGATYALNDPTQVTLDQDLGFTRILLKEPALFTGTATMVTLNARTAIENSGDIEGQLEDLEARLVNYVDNALASCSSYTDTKVEDLEGQLGDLNTYLVNYVDNALASCSSYTDTKVEDLEGQLGDLETYLVNYVDSALADYSSSLGPVNDPIVWTGTIDAGSDTISIPLSVGLDAGSIGILIVGGTTWSLDDLTISDSSIVLPEAVIVDHNVILVVL